MRGAALCPPPFARRRKMPQVSVEGKWGFVLWSKTLLWSFLQPKQGAKSDSRGTKTGILALLAASP